MSSSPALLPGTAFVIRLVFLTMPTGYDVYRYVWEGRILVEGFNPCNPPYGLGGFAVKSRNFGNIELAASGSAYSPVHYTLKEPGGCWTFSWWERVIIWLPYAVGFSVSRRRCETNERSGEGHLHRSRAADVGAEM